jgi:hypothetical protein
MRWMLAPIVTREARAALVDMLRSMQVQLDPGLPADRE